MKIFLYVMTAVWCILCVIGALFVMYSNSLSNAVYAVFPMTCTVLTGQLYQAIREKDTENKAYQDM